MRIVITGTFCFPSGTASAARMRQLALGFRENGAEVHLVPLAPSPVIAIDHSASEQLVFAQGITYELPADFIASLGLHVPPGADLGRRRIRIRRRMGWVAGIYGAMIPALRSLRRRLRSSGGCDLIIVYGRSALQIAPILRLARRHGIPVILDVVEINESFRGLGGKASPLYWDSVFATTRLAKRMDGVMVINDALENMYRSLGCEKVIVVPSIEGWDDVVPPSAASGGTFSLLYVGAMLPRDAPEVLLEAMRILHRRGAEVDLQIVGRYQQFSDGRRLAELIRRDPELRCVRLLGELGDEELAQHMRRAHGLLLTRRNARTEVFAFPTRLVEYLKNGRPVFVSDVGDIGSYLRDGQEAILLSADDPAAIADRIASVAQSPDRGRDIGLAGQARGAEVFNRKVHAARVLEFAGLIPARQEAGSSEARGQA